MGGGLVENHDRRLLEQQPRDRQPLLLTAGEPVATVPDDRVEAVGQRPHNGCNHGRLHRRPHLLLARLGTGVDEVRPDRVVEQMRILGDNAHGVAQRSQGDVADVMAADPDRPGPRVVHPGHQLADRRLPGAGRPHQGHQLTGCDAERDVMQDGFGYPPVEDGHRLQRRQRHLVRGRVTEADVVEFDRRRPARQVDRIRPVGDGRRQVEHLEHPLEGDQRGHHVDVDVRQLRQRPIEAGQVRRQRDDRADLKYTLGREPAADSVDDGGRQ